MPRYETSSLNARLSWLTAATVAVCLSSYVLSPPPASARLLKRLAASNHDENQPAHLRDKWALLVGVDRFQDPSIARNKSALRNVQALSATLENPLAGKFAADHVHVLSGSQATASGIKVEVDEWLVKKALPDDLIFIYICSVTNDDENGSPIVFAYDTLASESESSGLNLEDLLHSIRQLTGSRYIICALDTSDAPGAKGFAVPSLAKSGVSVLSATDGQQPSLNNGVTGSSVFIHHLDEAITLDGGQYTLKQVFEHVSSAVSHDAEVAFHTRQSPVLALADAGEAAVVALGAGVHGSQSAHTYQIGHPIDRLALDHPDIIAPRSGDAASNKIAHPQAAATPKTKPGRAAGDDEEEAPPKDVDFGPYMTKMKQDIQKRWTPPKELENRRIVALFTILRDGRIIDAHVVEGSGMPSVDQTALDALKAASPLDPLPPGSPPSVDIKYKFDWQVKRD